MSAEELAKALEWPMYCEECEHVERDPIMLDAERCSQCGGILAGMDDDDGQPSEQQEWHDYDADC